MKTSERESAVTAFFPTLRRLAVRVSRTINGAVEIDDLIGDGALGLLRAIDTYDPSYGTTLRQYARRVVLGAMLNGLRRIDPVSERARRAIRDAERERYANAQVEGRLRTFTELEYLNPALRRAREAAHVYSSVSLDGFSGGERTILADLRDEPSAQALRSSLSRELREALALLPQRQRQVVALHYYGEASMRTIGRRMGISAQRVSQLHAQALARLRTIVTAA